MYFYHFPDVNNIIIMYHASCNVLILLKQLLSYNPGRVATPTQEVRAGIWNLFMVPAIVHLHFAKDTGGIFDIHRLIPVDGMPSLTSIRRTAYTSMSQPARETPG